MPANSSRVDPVLNGFSGRAPEDPGSKEGLDATNGLGSSTISVPDSGTVVGCGQDEGIMDMDGADPNHVVQDMMVDVASPTVVVDPAVSGRILTSEKGSDRPSYAAMASKGNSMVGQFSNGDGLDNVVVSAEDYVIDKSGSFPKVKFVAHVHDHIDRNMRTSVIVRLLGRTIGTKHCFIVSLLYGSFRGTCTWLTSIIITF
ncbi:hypothetical protein V6N13_047607 [Hibiscus sabdariffa]|uniref:Uncharacterized protein n=1 Tax=Hibiscus sabdariffa TaxID=183260 RepID=A0ABR2F4P3_9ROSI